MYDVPRGKPRRGVGFLCEGKMMVRYFKGTKNRAIIIHETVLKYIESYMKFLEVAEQRAALKLSPDRNLAWQNAFRLQRLLQKQLAPRFEYLFGRGTFGNAPWESLDSIFERLNQGWSQAEEAELKGNAASYAETSREIEDIQSKWDPNLIADPDGALQQDYIFRNAQMALSESSKKLRVQLSQ
jgi:hypothetical protein